jgi:hypothetical protein
MGAMRLGKPRCGRSTGHSRCHDKADICKITPISKITPPLRLICHKSYSPGAFREATMTELLIAAALVAGLAAAHAIGFWLGSLTRSADEPFDQQVALVRTSTAALVAFLIGFAFSGAASRFVDRADIVVKEANALGTAYLRADTIANLNAAS